MKLTASLPMYDFPEVRGALGVVWSHVALRLEQVGVEEIPAVLEHGKAHGRQVREAMIRDAAVQAKADSRAGNVETEFDRG